MCNCYKNHEGELLKEFFMLDLSFYELALLLFGNRNYFRRILCLNPSPVCAKS